MSVEIELLKYFNGRLVSVSGALNYALACSDSESFRTFFDGELPSSWNDLPRIADLKFRKSTAVLRHTGRPCGRKFGSGEPIYRCLQCSEDETCVLCGYCFNKQDHEGHFVKTVVATALNSGCCDCGDPEAWTKQLHCKCELIEAEETEEQLSPEFVQQLETVVRTIFSFILGTFNHHKFTLPYYIKWLLSTNDREFVKYLKHSTNDFLEINYGIVRKPLTQYALLVCNDDTTPFDTAEDLIESLGELVDHKSPSEAALAVHQLGRYLAIVTEQPSGLLKKFKSIYRDGTDGILSTVENMQDVEFEEICHELLEWIHTLTDHKVLLQPARDMIQKILVEQVSLQFSGDTVKLGLLNQTGHLPGFDLNCFLEYFLYFSIRMPTHTRTLMQSLIVESFLIDLEFKKKFAVIYSGVYELMVQLHAADKEFSINVMADITAQLFTAPSVPKTIMMQGLFPRFLRPFVLFLERTESKGVWNFIFGRTVVARQNSHVFGVVSGDLTFMAEKLPAELKHLFFKPPVFDLLVELLAFIQGRHKVQRKIGRHVEEEDEEGILIHEIFNFVLKLLVSMFNGAEYSAEAVDSSIKKLILAVDLDLPMKRVYYNDSAYDIMDFKVSKQPTALVNPVNSLLSMLIENNVVNLKALDKDSIFKISDISLRSIALCGQISTGFWVRNGDSILYQLAMYQSLSRHSHSSAHGYLRDLHLVQLNFLVSEDPMKSFINVLDRWELFEWINKDTYFSEEMGFQNTVYVEKLNNVLFQFLLFLYRVVTERKFFILQSSEEKKKSLIYYLILYYLSNGPAKYSSIELNVVVHEAGETILEILGQIAEFKPPVGLNDLGTFSLKKEYYNELDPFSVFSTKPEQLEQNMKAKIFQGSSKTYKDKDEVVVKPIVKQIDEKFASFTDFARTTIFNKFVFKLMNMVRFEPVVHLLLHLLHAVFLDNQLVKGKDYMSGSYLLIACQLFSLLDNKSMSVSIKSQCLHLLKFLIGIEGSNVMEHLTENFSAEKLKILTDLQERSMNDRAARLKFVEEKKRRAFQMLADQRKKFVENNNNEDEEDDEAEAHENIKTCIACQEPQSDKNPLLVIVKCPQLERFFTISENCTQEEIERNYDMWDTSVCLDDGAVFAKIPSRNESVDVDRILMSCNHGLHEDCATTYFDITQKKFKRCPLCYFAGDILVPVNEPGKLSGDFFNDLLTQENTLEVINKALTDHSVLGLRTTNKRILLGLLTYESNSAPFVNSFARTIECLEIAARFSSGYCNYLQDIPEITLSGLRVIALFVFDKAYIQKASALSSYVDDRHSPIVEFMKRLQGGSAFSEQLMGIYSAQLVLIYRLVRKCNVQTYRKYGTLESSPQLRKLKAVFGVPDEIAALGIVKMVERCLLPFFRQVMILLRILTFDPDSGNVYYQLENAINDKVISKLQELELAGKPADTLAPYLEFFELPNLEKILEAISCLNVDVNRSVPFAGVIKLIPLPRRLDTFTTDSDSFFKHFEGPAKTRENTIDFDVCLLCGEKIPQLTSETQESSNAAYDHNLKKHRFEHSLLLDPIRNLVYFLSATDTENQDRAAQLVFDSPYMNDWGESGYKSLNKNSWNNLNEKRYKNFIKKWLLDDFSRL